MAEAKTEVISLRCTATQKKVLTKIAVAKEISLKALFATYIDKIVSEALALQSLFSQEGGNGA